MLDETEGLAAMFDPEVFGRAAGYQAGGSGPSVEVTVVLSRGDESWRGQLGGIAVAARVLLVRASEIAEPQRGDRFTVAGEAFLVQTPKALDPDRRIWACELKPAG